MNASNITSTMAALADAQALPQKSEDTREFLAHLFLECMIRYQNETWNSNATMDMPAEDELVGGIPRYLEEAILNEGTIDMDNIDVVAVEQSEMHATVHAYAATTTNSKKMLGNFTVLMKPKKEQLFCPVRFDGYLCWPRTPAGTVLSQYCPDFIEGFNEKFLAHKTCLENGTWYHHPISGQEWSNYTNCIDYDDLQFRQFVNELYVKGYATSLIALLLSIIIFLGFKSLRCTRIRIHVHLFASLALTCTAWILWYKLVVEQPDVIRVNAPWCIAMHLVIHYFMLVNYFWMFCEGLHLHLVLVVVFVKDVVVMRFFKCGSWGLPILFVAVYGLARYLSFNDNTHCWINDSLLLWIFSAPITIALCACFFFLINVLRVIVRKLHPQSSQPAPLAIRKAVRATIILVPLFGLQHFLLPFRPDVNSPLERFYQLLSVVLVSLQGFVVSVLFCFANHDVTFAVRSLLNRLLPSVIAPPPASVNTGQMATTTPSRELGV